MNFEDIFICTTDTVTGIGGPVNENTLKCIYYLKNRPISKKIIILVGSIEQARAFKEWNNEADDFAAKYWPGAYSIIVNGQGFRMPNNSQLCQFLLKNGPMYVNISANNFWSRSNSIYQKLINIFPLVKNALCILWQR
nr:Sua5/YciO/YrdC/YwlC family protein [Mycoplasmopsis bovis]